MNKFTYEKLKESLVLLETINMNITNYDLDRALINLNNLSYGVTNSTLGGKIYNIGFEIRQKRNMESDSSLLNLLENRIEPLYNQLIGIYLVDNDSFFKSLIDDSNEAISLARKELSSSFTIASNLMDYIKFFDKNVFLKFADEYRNILDNYGYSKLGYLKLIDAIKNAVGRVYQIEIDKMTDHFIKIGKK